MLHEPAQPARMTDAHPPYTPPGNADRANRKQVEQSVDRNDGSNSDVKIAPLARPPENSMTGPNGLREIDGAASNGLGEIDGADPKAASVLTRPDDSAPATGPRAPVEPCWGERPSQRLARRLHHSIPDSLPTIGACLDSSLYQVRAAVMDLRRLIAAQGAPAESCDVMELVLAEVLNNVVEHAYRGEPTGWIEVEVDITGAWIACSVRDGGHPMPGGVLPHADGPDMDTPVESLPESGFGWPLIRTLAAHLAYERRDSVNDLFFAISPEADTDPQSRRPHRTDRGGAPA